MHSIDHKGRISVPARFRKALSGRASATFVIVRGLETCVAIYPQDEWKRMEERLRSRSFYDETNRRFLRTMTIDSDDATLDAQGRVAIPPRLLAHARLTKEAMVNGVIDHLETPLVKWGWAPGDGRSTPPMTYAEFTQKMRAWIDNGGACPE